MCKVKATDLLDKERAKYYRKEYAISFSILFLVMLVIILAILLYIANDENGPAKQKYAEAAETISEQQSQISDLKSQISDLQSQLDAKTDRCNELAGELDGMNVANNETQEVYEEGWIDACDNYGIDADTGDVPDYGYYGKMSEPDEPTSPTAYITPSGKRYHLSQSCAGENAIQTTIADASDKGYSPCAKCAQ